MNKPAFLVGSLASIAITLFAAGASAADAHPAASKPASEPADSGLTLGARLGYALPLGESAQSAALSKTYSGALPIWLDAGYRFSKNWFVGGYFQYAFAFVSSDACQGGASCSGSVVRFGAQGTYTFDTPSVRPWAGLGIGYEIASLSASSNGASASGSSSGFEFLQLQGGADFDVASALRLGPFASFSVAQYASASASTSVGSGSGDIQNKAIHDWFTLGVRGRFDL